jgi:hypothetical protein
MHNMEEIISRSTVGILGTITSFSLQSIDTIASIIVAVTTTVYMAVSIYKIIKSLNK